MKFHNDTAQIYIPDALPLEGALQRTTHLAVSAHQDDSEIMSTAPILECFQRKDKWFTGVVVTDGRGSPRQGLYQAYSDEEMRLVRFKEQRKAAMVGEYAAQILLDYPSQVVKDRTRLEPVEDLAQILKAARPHTVYTHNLADKHDTHVSVALRTIAAIRSLPPADRPQRLLGSEVWRALDWMADSDKVIMDVSGQENLQASLLGVFDSQITGGKRYDLATLGRRRANATYAESHQVDVASGLSFAMDMTPLIREPAQAPDQFLRDLLEHFEQDIFTRLGKFS